MFIYKGIYGIYGIYECWKSGRVIKFFRSSRPANVKAKSNIGDLTS